MPQLDERVRETANALALANVRFARAFQIAKMKPETTDRLATQIAVEQTNSEVTRLEAEYKIALLLWETVLKKGTR